MKLKDALTESIAGAALIAFAFYFFSSVFFGDACGVAYTRADRVDENSTLILMAVSLWFATSLPIFLTKISMKGEKLENIDKLVALAAGAWILIWLGYVAVDGEYCSLYSWRFYGVLLILPISIAGLAVLGRHWMTNDK